MELTLEEQMNLAYRAWRVARVENPHGDDCRRKLAAVEDLRDLMIMLALRNERRNRENSAK